MLSNPIWLQSGSSINLFSDLMYYWKMDDLTESHAGNNFTTSVNATLTAGGVINSYYAFNNGRLISDSNLGASVTGGSSRTLSCWLLPSVNQQDKHPINWGFDNTYRAFGVWINPTNRINFYGYAAGDAATGVLMTNGLKYHFVAAFDGITKDLFLYVNGVLTNTVSRPLLNTDDSPLTVGTRNDLTKSWVGGVDEIGIWSRCLVLEDVVALYNSGNGLSYNNF